MSNNHIQTILTELFEKWASEEVTSILPLARSGSNRKYFRIKGDTKSVIGTYGMDTKENKTFISFSKHFYEKGLPVPEVLISDLAQGIYLQEDLGNATLYHLLTAEDHFSDSSKEKIKKTLEELAQIQIKGGEGLDYNQCYPRVAFDKQSMMWDLNTFKYYFLKLANIPFDEQALEEDFHRFTDYLLQADCEHFMFRDFQSRNIMWRNDAPVFIDYQGGRRGAMQYDLASLLFQPKAGIPFETRMELLNYYMDVVEKMIDLDRKRFVEFFFGYVLIRRIQAFGTYGLRGLYERKQYFINSIAIAAKDIKWVLENAKMSVEVPEMMKALHAIVASKQFQIFDKENTKTDSLTVRINSFSYKKGLPEDPSGNGGGFNFDCRFIHNPGRYEPYKKLTGRDQPVIDFLKEHSNMQDFLNNVYHIVDEAVENYIERDFSSLMTNFGCTGGQHRSVFAADSLAAHLRQKYGVRVELHHIVQEAKNWIN